MQVKRNSRKRNTVLSNAGLSVALSGSGPMEPTSLPIVDRAGSHGLITPCDIETVERFCNLVMKIVLFLFVLGGVAVMTSFFVNCELRGKSIQAKTASAYVDILFVTVFRIIVGHFFPRKAPFPLRIVDQQFRRWKAGAEDREKTCPR
jgi:hypothetical protein